MKTYSFLLPDHKPGWLEFSIVLFLVGILGGALVLTGIANALPWFVDLLLVVAFSLFAASLFDLSDGPAFLLAVYLLLFANIVLTGEIGSLLGILGSRAYFLAAHLVLAGLAFFAWQRIGRPPLLAPLETFIRKLSWRRFVKSLVSYPLIWLLALAVIAVYGIGLYLTLAEPQNIDDVLTTHLARAGYWLQNGSLVPWPTSTYNLPQVVGPPNAQFLIAWGVLFWGSGQLTGMAQWMAVWVSMVAIYGLGCQLGASRWQGAVAALLFAAFPCIVLQSTQALFDITIAVLFVCVVFFLFLGLRRDLSKALWLSAIALGLAVGTKQTIFFALPGLAVFIGLILLTGDRQCRWNVIRWCRACAVGVFVLGTYTYAQNLVFFGHPLGPPQLIGEFTSVRSSLMPGERIEMTGKNLECMAAFASYGELPRELIEDWEIPICRDQIERIKRDTIKDGSYGWFGPVGFVFFFIAVGYGIWTAVAKKGWYPLGMVIIFTCYTLILAFVRQYTAANSRYMILAMILVMPVAAAAIQKNNLLVLAVVVSLYFMGYTRFYDGSKPLIGEQAVGTIDRISRISYYNMEDHETMLRVVEEDVPEDAVLGIIMPEKAPHSPLFGEHFTHTVVPFDQPYPASIDARWIESRNLDYLLIQTVILQYGTGISDDVEIIPVDEYYLLLTTYHE